MCITKYTAPENFMLYVVFLQTDVIRAIARLVEFYKHESCGQCTPCREGKGLHNVFNTSNKTVNMQ